MNNVILKLNIIVKMNVVLKNLNALENVKKKQLWVVRVNVLETNKIFTQNN